MRRIIVELKGIDMHYPLGAQALRGVGLSIPEGEFLALLGPPGTGKSTLLRVLGLVQPPTAGSVWLDGRLVTGSGPVPAVRLVIPAGAGWEGVVGELEAGVDATVRLLLADEPTARLDSAGGARVMDCLTRLNAVGLAVVVATADPEVAARCPVIYRMRDGQIRRVDR